MKRIASILLVSLLAALALPAAAERRELSPEERREVRQQMREHWSRDNLGPVRQRDDAAPQWRDLPPEERSRLRRELREQHDRDGGPDRRRFRRDD